MKRACPFWHGDLLIMSYKLAFHANLWYNKLMNIVCQSVAGTTSGVMTRKVNFLS